MQCLGIDIGSTSIKGAVLDLATMQVGEPVVCAFPPPVTGLSAGRVEVSSRAICMAVESVLSKLVAKSPDANRLYFSGQMGGVILIDERGRAVSNYISWRDQRTVQPNAAGQSTLESMRDCWESNGYLTNLGRELQPGSMSTLLAWLKKQRQLPHDVIPCPVADFVIARLVGQPIPMHATHAIGMLDLQRDEWHRTALEAIGLGNLPLPELALKVSRVGTAQIGGHSFQVYGSFGDQQCALRGARLQREELSLNVSTGSQVSRRTSQFQPGPYQSRKYFFGDYLDTVTHIPAGRSLNVLVELLTELGQADGLAFPNVWKVIQEKVEAVSESDLDVDLSFFAGPLGDRGCISGITTENLTVGNLFHAAYRSMAENYRTLADRFQPADWKSIVLSGGLTQGAPRLRKLIQQRFTAPMRESAGEETLLGLLDIAQMTVEQKT